MKTTSKADAFLNDPRTAHTENKKEPLVMKQPGKVAVEVVDKTNITWSKQILLKANSSPKIGDKWMVTGAWAGRNPAEKEDKARKGASITPVEVTILKGASTLVVSAAAVALVTCLAF